MFSFRKFFKRLFWGSLIFLLVLGGVGYTLVTVYEDEVKQAIVGEVNEYLTAQVSVSDIHLSLWNQFPNASLTLEGTSIISLNEELKDTVVLADQIFLEFNIWDLFQKRYEVKEIELDAPFLNLHIDSLGRENYVFWKTREDSVQRSSKVAFDLQKVTLNGARIHYRNDIKKEDYAFDQAQVNLEGHFLANRLNLKAQTQAYVQHFRSRGVQYLGDKQVELDVDLALQLDSALYAVERGTLAVEKMVYDVSGHYDGKKSWCDFIINSNRFSVPQLASLLPEDIRLNMLDYNLDGQLQFETKIVGEASKYATPFVTSSFRIAQGKLKNKRNGMALQDIQFNGRYQNRQEGKRDEELVLEKFQAQLLNSNVSTQGRIRTLRDPYLDLKATGNADLKALADFLGLEDVEQVKGRVDLQMDIVGLWRHIKKGRLKRFNGKFNFEEAQFVHRASGTRFEQVKVKTKVRGNAVQVLKGSSLVINKQRIETEGQLRDLIPYLAEEKGKLGGDFTLHVGTFDLTRFLTEDKGGSSASSNQGPLFPEYLHMRTRVVVDHFIYEDLEAQDVRGLVTLRNGKLNGDNLRFNSCGGKVKGKLQLENVRQGSQLSVDADLEGVEIDRVFSAFKDFGQEVIQAENIGGKTNAHIRAVALLDQNLEMVADRLQCDASVQLQQGYLKDLEAFEELTAYMKTNKMLKLAMDVDAFGERLKSVQFETLENELSIRRGKIQIPQMEIKSSALDVSLSGTHGFDQSFDYHMAFRLPDLFAKEKESEFGKIIDDGTGIRLYFRMKGDLDNYSFSLDNDSRKEALKQNLQEEKVELKQILKEEFGLFKRDTSVKAYEEEDKPEAEIQVEWEDAEVEQGDDGSSSEEDSRSSKRKKKKERPKLNKFLKKIGAEEEEREEGTLELDKDEEL